MNNLPKLIATAGRSKLEPGSPGLPACEMLSLQAGCGAPRLQCWTLAGVSSACCGCGPVSTCCLTMQEFQNQPDTSILPPSPRSSLHSSRSHPCWLWAAAGQCASKGAVMKTFLGKFLYFSPSLINIGFPVNLSLRLPTCWFVLVWGSLL